MDADDARTRAARNRMLMAKAQINSVNMQLQTQAAMVRAAALGDELAHLELVALVVADPGVGDEVVRVAHGCRAVDADVDGLDLATCHQLRHAGQEGGLQGGQGQRRELRLARGHGNRGLPLGQVGHRRVRHDEHVPGGRAAGLPVGVGHAELGLEHRLGLFPRGEDAVALEVGGNLDGLGLEGSILGGLDDWPRSAT